MNTKPSWLQRFFAKEWVWKFAFWGCPLCIGLTIGLHFYQQQRSSIQLILFAAVTAVVISYFFLHTLWHLRAWINGAPFYHGDTVKILVGEHKDQIVNIYQVWEERYQVRVEIGEQAKKDVKDVFGFIEICRARKVRPNKSTIE